MCASRHLQGCGDSCVSLGPALVVMVNPGTPKISADLVRALLRSRGKISGATLTCAAAALLGCPEATDDEKVRFYMFLIKRLEQIATDDECRANVHKLVRYPDEVKADDAAALQQSSLGFTRPSRG